MFPIVFMHTLTVFYTNTLSKCHMSTKANTRIWNAMLFTDTINLATPTISMSCGCTHWMSHWLLCCSKPCSQVQWRCVTMNSSDLWTLCGRRAELCAFLHLRLGATIPLCTSSIGHFTWTNWVQVQSRRLSDVVWRLFLNGGTRCSLPRCLPSQVAPVFIGQRYFPLWELQCFSWALPVK